MPLFDVKCDNCGKQWEQMKKWEDLAQCPECGSINTTTLMPLMKHKRAKTPDEMMGRIPDSKPVKSFANDRRRGGKDTS